MIKAKPFATGQAQPTQSPYAGSTQHKKNPAGDFAAYSPAQQFGNTTLNQSYSPGSSPYSQAPQMPTSPADGNWANYATQNRPAPFTASYGQPDGSYSSTPNYNQRDAFIQALNDQYTPYMTGQRTGAPQYDIGAAWNQASQMVQQGWQNPFAPNLAAQAQQGPLPSLAAQAFPSQYQPSNLSMAPPAPQQQAALDKQAATWKHSDAREQAGKKYDTAVARANARLARGDITKQEHYDLTAAANRLLDRDGKRIADQFVARTQPPAAPTPPPAPSTGVRVAPGSGPSWTPVPGYGFDRQGNQVPVGKGGIFNEPPPQRQQAESPYSGGLIKNAGSDRLGSWMSSRRAENKRLAADAFQRAKTPEEKMQAFRFPQNYGIYT